MSAELIRYQRDNNSGDLYAIPPNGKHPIIFEVINHKSTITSKSKQTKAHYWSFISQLVGKIKFHFWFSNKF